MRELPQNTGRAVFTGTGEYNPESVRAMTDTIWRTQKYTAEGI